MTKSRPKTDRKRFELANERNTEKRYAKQLIDAAKKMPRPKFFAGLKVPKLPSEPLGELVGRIALSNPNDVFLDGRHDFYIGERHANVDGVEVYSWTAPIACSYFRHNHSHDCYPEVGELCEKVAVIRTFIRRNGQIVDFSDDVVGESAPKDPFPGRGLNIPKPPPTANKLSAALNPGVPGSKPHQRDPDPPEWSRTPSQGSGAAVEGRQSGVQLRAASALRAQLRAPRAKSLSSVLGTLQPDQYELVTKPAMESIVIEGHPGTGKTIVAAHRAAYLVHEDTPAESTLDGTVLLVGPTVGYTNHVRGVVTRLSGRSSRIKVLSLPELMRVILGNQQLPSGPASTSWQDADWKLGRFARLAITRLTEANGTLPTVEEAYEYLCRNGAPRRPITRDVEWATYLRGLPPVKSARTVRAHAPLLSLIKWELDAPAALRGVELIIVDEAQDVSKLEWLLLQQINEADAWTILGDLNQRHSDHTLFDWPKLFDVLALDEQTPVRSLSNGYRSTRPILEFANRLLPRDQRTVIAIQQDGPDPVVEKTEAKRLGATALRHLERLRFTYPSGTIAVIGPDTSAVTKSMRATRWRTSRDHAHVWERDDHEVTVLDPETARGIEFDAVIVVEPASFQETLTKRGPLYTALTRPNRELVVLHAKPLPRELRR